MIREGAEDINNCIDDIMCISKGKWKKFKCLGMVKIRLKKEIMFCQLLSILLKQLFSLFLSL